MSLPPNLLDASDSLLMALIADGQPDGAEVLISRYRRSLTGFLRRALGGAPEYDDLFQETWMRVVRSAHRFDPSCPFPPWLFRIALNLVREFWAREKTRTRVIAPGGTELATESAAAGDSAEETLAARERADTLAVALEALPGRLAETIVLRYFEEMSEREVACRLAIPPGTVKSRLHHGLKKLGTLLEGKLP